MINSLRNLLADPCRAQLSRFSSSTLQSSAQIVTRPLICLQSNNVYRAPGSDKAKKNKFGKHGRGNKGFKARQGKNRPVPGFEGGQTGILKAFRKIGTALRLLKI